MVSGGALDTDLLPQYRRGSLFSLIFIANHFLQNILVQGKNSFCNRVCKSLCIINTYLRHLILQSVINYILRQCIVSYYF